MTRDEAKQLLPIIEAYANGKQIQFKIHEDDFWSDSSEDLGYRLGFNKNPSYYRIKPEPKIVPMTYEDFKGIPIVWVRKDNKLESLITDFGRSRNCFWSGEELFNYTDNDLEWSTDRITWHKFEKEIEA